MVRVRGIGRRRVAIEQRAGVERSEEPLVRVDDDRVGVLDAGEERARRRRRERGAAVRTVDMEPHAALRADLGDRREIVDQPEVRRAGGGDDRERAPARSRQCAGDGLAVEPTAIVDLGADEIGIHRLRPSLEWTSARTRQRRWPIVAAGVLATRLPRDAPRRVRRDCRRCHRRRSIHPRPPVGRRDRPATAAPDSRRRRHPHPRATSRRRSRTR